jgi:hypothetical protein
MRFSLTTAFLLMTIAALAVSHWKLHQEVCRYRNADLDLSDPTWIHYKRLACKEPGTWKWRVYLPNGDFTVRMNIPGQIAIQNYTLAADIKEKPFDLVVSVRDGFVATTAGRDTFDSVWSTKQIQRAQDSWRPVFNDGRQVDKPPSFHAEFISNGLGGPFVIIRRRDAIPWGRHPQTAATQGVKK